MRTLPVVVLLAALAWACGSSPSAPTTPQSAPGPAPGPPPPALLSRYHVSGVVTDDSGAPIPNAPVEVSYDNGRVATRTNSGGSYDVDVSPISLGFGRASFALGAVSASAGGYWPNVQVLQPDGPDVIQNLRLRPVRRISAGSSITMSMDPDSSLVGLVVDDWSYWDLRNALEKFLVDTNKAGELFIRADAADDGSGYPYLMACRAVPSGCSWMAGGQGDISFGVEAGKLYEISVSAPRRTPSRRYTVTTSLER